MFLDRSVVATTKGLGASCQVWRIVKCRIRTHSEYLAKKIFSCTSRAFKHQRKNDGTRGHENTSSMEERFNNWRPQEQVPDEKPSCAAFFSYAKQSCKPILVSQTLIAAQKQEIGRHNNAQAKHKHRSARRHRETHEGNYTKTNDPGLLKKNAYRA